MKPATACFPIPDFVYQFLFLNPWCCFPEDGEDPMTFPPGYQHRGRVIPYEGTKLLDPKAHPPPKAALFEETTSCDVDENLIIRPNEIVFSREQHILETSAPPIIALSAYNEESAQGILFFMDKKSVTPFSEPRSILLPFVKKALRTWPQWFERDYPIIVFSVISANRTVNTLFSAHLNTILETILIYHRHGQKCKSLQPQSLHSRITFDPFTGHIGEIPRSPPPTTKRSPPLRKKRYFKTPKRPDFVPDISKEIRAIAARAEEAARIKQLMKMYDF